MVWKMFTLIFGAMMQFDAPIFFKRVGEPTRFCIYFLPVGKESWTFLHNLVECQWSWQGYVTVNDPGVLTATLALTRDTTYPSIQWSRFFPGQTDKMNPKMSIKFHRFPSFWAHNTTPPSPLAATCPTVAHWTWISRCEWISKTWPLFSWTNGSWKSWILGSP